MRFDTVLQTGAYVLNCIRDRNLVKEKNREAFFMKILVACEESQATTIELRKLGHEAFSCDIQDCSGGHPEWHIKGDVLNVLNDGWDLMIGHPTCTYLTNSGVCWLYNKDGSKNTERWDNLKEAAKFFKALLDAPIPLIAIENPIPHKYAVELIGRKYDQLVQPYMFGDAESKATCFWLKGLPKLKETYNVKEIWKALPKQQAQRLHYLPPGPERAKLRSKTFPGIAKAMATQWTNHNNFEKVEVGGLFSNSFQTELSNEAGQ